MHSRLSVFLRALATRILFKDGAAIGVEIQRSGVMELIMARREVVLCAGAFNSPQLLQRSGIGPGDLLHACGLPVVRHVSGVGENLQDHFSVPTSYRCTTKVTINDVVNSPVRKTLMGVRYLLTRRGLLASNANYANAFVKSESTRATPDLMLSLALWSRNQKASGLGLHRHSGFGVLVSLLYPESRGSVRIESANIQDSPAIRLNFFSTPPDRQKCLTGRRIARRVMQQPSIARYVVEELAPGPAIGTDQDLISYCRQRGRSVHHASGTCKMGHDEAAVVDSRLRVHGVS